LQVVGTPQNMALVPSAMQKPLVQSLSKVQDEKSGPGSPHVLGPPDGGSMHPSPGTQAANSHDSPRLAGAAQAGVMPVGPEPQ
jgi:hypothetical protein